MIETELERLRRSVPIARMALPPGTSFFDVLKEADRQQGSVLGRTIVLILATVILLFSAFSIEALLSPMQPYVEREPEIHLPSPARKFVRIYPESDPSPLWALPSSADFYLRYTNPDLYWTYRHNFVGDATEMRAIPIVRYAFK